MSIKEVIVPDIGNFKDVEVIEILVKPGDAIVDRSLADDRGIRQGRHGHPRPVRRHGQGTQDQGRRQGLRPVRWC